MYKFLSVHTIINSQKWTRQFESEIMQCSIYLLLGQYLSKIRKDWKFIFKFQLINSWYSMEIHTITWWLTDLFCPYKLLNYSPLTSPELAQRDQQVAKGSPELPANRLGLKGRHRQEPAEFRRDLRQEASHSRAHHILRDFSTARTRPRKARCRTDTLWWGGLSCSNTEF